VYIAAVRNETRQHRQVGEAAGLGRVTADALEVIALEIELARFEKAGFGQPPLRLDANYPIF
jgi:hypothetical protein